MKLNDGSHGKIWGGVGSEKHIQHSFTKWNPHYYQYRLLVSMNTNVSQQDRI